MDFVGPLSLNVANDNACLGVTISLDFKRNVGRGLCLNLKGGSMEWVILGE